MEKNLSQLLIRAVAPLVHTGPCEDVMPHPGAAAFHSRTVPRAPLQFFMDRLVEYMRCDAEAFVCGLWYILLLTKTPAAGPAMAERSEHLPVPMQLTMHNIHRLLFACFTVAAKVRSEGRTSLSYYAYVGGVDTKEAARLELALLQMLNWNAHVSTRSYHNALSYLVSQTIRPCDLLSLVDRNVTYPHETDKQTDSQEADDVSAVKTVDSSYGTPLTLVREVVRRFGPDFPSTPMTRAANQAVIAASRHCLPIDALDGNATIDSVPKAVMSMVSSSLRSVTAFLNSVSDPRSHSQTP